MILVKSLHSDQPYVICPAWVTIDMHTCKFLMSWQLADAVLMPCKCYSAYIIVEFMCVHKCTYTGGSHVGNILRGSELISRCSEYLLRSCSKCSFLECLPPTEEAWFDSRLGHVSLRTSALG